MTLPLRPPLPRPAVPRAGRVPYLAAWYSAVAQAWAVLAGLALASGVLWRAAGGAPALPQALDAAGFALGLSALWLAPPLERMLAGLREHQPWPRLNWRLAPGLTGHTCLSLLALAGAPAALLLAYSAGANVVSVLTAEGYTFDIALAPAALGALLLFGTGLALSSTALLVLLRRLLQPGLGALAWLLLLALHHGALCGTLWQPQRPLTLGSYFSWATLVLGRTATDPSRYDYLSELTTQVLIPPGIALLAGLALLLLGAYVARARAAAIPAWAVPAAAVALAACRSAVQTYHWTRDLSLRDPGAWQGVLALGLVVLLSGAILRALAVRPALSAWRALLAELYWGWWALAACALCTMPYVLTGQALQRDVLWGLLAAGMIATPVLVAVHRLQALARTHPALAQGVLYLLLAVLLLPLGHLAQAGLPGAALALGAGLAVPEQASPACWALGCAAALALALWPWPSRGRGEAMLRHLP